MPTPPFFLVKTRDRVLAVQAPGVIINKKKHNNDVVAFFFVYFLFYYYYCYDGRKENK